MSSKILDLLGKVDEVLDEYSDGEYGFVETGQGKSNTKRNLGIIAALLLAAALAVIVWKRNTLLNIEIRKVRLRERITSVTQK